MTRIICCGSNKYYKYMLNLIKQMHPEVSISNDMIYIKNVEFILPKKPDNENAEFSDAEYELLLLHHLNDIQIADIVLIFNYDGYVGNSTCAEIAYARALGKYVVSLCPCEDKSINGLINASIYPCMKSAEEIWEWDTRFIFNSIMGKYLY